jgi:hypothetical protein
LEHRLPLAVGTKAKLKKRDHFETLEQANVIGKLAA